MFFEQINNTKIKNGNKYFLNDRLKTIKLFFLLTAPQVRQEGMTTGGTRPPFSFEKRRKLKSFKIINLLYYIK